jgi:hypothetical protein
LPMTPMSLAKLTSSNASTMALPKIPLSSLHIMMITRNTKTPSSSILIPGGMMKKLQTSWERLYLQKFCLLTSPLERVRLVMSYATYQL